MRREPELYKDKVEVSLDGRQIFYLFFGGAVIVGIVFVLGVMVGRRVEARGHVDTARTHATTDPLAALDNLESTKPNLSFQQTLTNAPVDKKVDKGIEHKIEEVVRVRAEKKAKPEDKKAEKAEKVADKKSEDKKSEKSEKKKSEDKKAEPTNPDVVTASHDDKKSEDRKASDDKKASEDKRASDDKKPEEKRARFTLQLSSFQDRGEADAFLSNVKAAGYQAYVTEAEVSGKGTFYRVRLGKYGSMDAANEAKADVEKALKKTASIMRL